MEIIPLVCFLLMVGVSCGPWRERFLLASVGWGVLVLVLTELLSLWHGLDRVGLAIAWSVLSLALGLRYWLVKPGLPQYPLSFHWKIIVLVLMVSAILAVTAVIAFYAAPNNWDSMTYHLARVAHWAQDKSVAMYPTVDPRQINFPPWASYAMAQFYILADSDRWVNFIQWFSSLGSMIGVSLIVARLGGGFLAQALAALIAATIPMGILQSTSTQNDYVVAFWLVCFVYFGLGLLKQNKWCDALAAAASLGLAGLAKGTGYLYGSFFLIWIIAGGLKKYGRGFLPRVAAVLLGVVLLNSFYYARNLSLEGRIFPSGEAANVINDRSDLKVVLANLALNFGIQTATVWDRPNRWVENAVGQMHRWLGINEGDLRVSDGSKFVILDRSFRFHEDYAGNFIHTLLILFCLLASIVLGRRIPEECRSYALCLLGGIILFVVMIKWLPFNGRLHLPVFVLFAPFLAVVLVSCLGPEGSMVLAVILVLASVPWVVGNTTRPLFGPKSVVTVARINQYFLNRPEAAYYAFPLNIAAKVNCKQIGLVIGGDEWEYPLAVISREQKLDNPRFEHILMNNASMKLPYPLGAFDPCLIIKEGNSGPDLLNWQGVYFRKVYERGPMLTYLRV